MGEVSKRLSPTRRTLQGKTLRAALRAAGGRLGISPEMLDRLARDAAERGLCELERRDDAGRRGGARGGRARIIPAEVDPLLVAVADATGAVRRRLAEELAAERGVAPESILRAVRRLRKK